MSAIEFPPLRERSWLQRGLDALLGAPLRLQEPSLERLILWAPVALGLGAALYFLPTVEPSRHIGQALVVTAVIAIALCPLVRARSALVYMVLLIAFTSLGFALAQWRTLDAAPPVLDLGDRAVQVEGWIEAVERGGNRPRLRIRVASLSGVEDPPHRVRVRVGLGDFIPGDSIRVRAVLTPLPGPAVPGGYDPARAAWYDQIALSGFAVTRLSASEPDTGDGFARALARYRWTLAERIRSQVGPETGGIAAALLTGDRSGVDEDDAEALRVSGLGHILAISGLHMALFAGGVYFVVRYAFAAIERFARAHDPRKPAAVIALIAATAYLILSGAAIPTQRAWVMAVVVLVGVMLDRRAFSMRSLALAALVVIILAPQSVVEAGFQMSFAAVAALIAVYDIWSRMRPKAGGPAGLLGKGVDAFGGLATTSVVAGGATGAFAAFHFQRIAAFGLIANLAAMPIFTFWVMPAGVIALALSPFGLEGAPLAVMGLGLQLVLTIAYWTAGLEGAGVSVLAANGLVVALYAMGFAAMTIGLGLVRVGGMAVCSVALALWTVQSPADLMITDDGVVVAQFETDGVFQASSLRSSRFESRVFMQRIGQGGERLGSAELACDPLGCFGVTRDGIRIALTQNREALEEDCRRADLVVFSGTLSSWQKRRCEAVLLDAERLATHGALEFTVENGSLAVSGTAQERRRERIWSRPPR